MHSLDILHKCPFSLFRHELPTGLRQRDVFLCWHSHQQQRQRHCSTLRSGVLLFTLWLIKSSQTLLESLPFALMVSGALMPHGRMQLHIKTIFGAGMKSRLITSFQWIVDMCIHRRERMCTKWSRNRFTEREGLTVPSYYPGLLPHVRSHLCDVVTAVLCNSWVPPAPHPHSSCIQLYTPTEMPSWKSLQVWPCQVQLREPGSAVKLLLMQKGSLKNSPLLSSYIFLTGSFWHSFAPVVLWGKESLSTHKPAVNFMLRF